MSIIFVEVVHTIGQHRKCCGFTTSLALIHKFENFNQINLDRLVFAHVRKLNLFAQ